MSIEQLRRCWAAVDLTHSGRVRFEQFAEGVRWLWEHKFAAEGVVLPPRARTSAHRARTRSAAHPCRLTVRLGVLWVSHAFACNPTPPPAPPEPPPPPPKNDGPEAGPAPSSPVGSAPLRQPSMRAPPLMRGSGSVRVIAPKTALALRTQMSQTALAPAGATAAAAAATTAGAPAPPAAPNAGAPPAPLGATRGSPSSSASSLAQTPHTPTAPSFAAAGEDAAAEPGGASRPRSHSSQTPNDVAAVLDGTAARRQGGDGKSATLDQPPASRRLSRPDLEAIDTSSTSGSRSVSPSSPVIPPALEKAGASVRGSSWIRPFRKSDGAKHRSAGSKDLKAVIERDDGAATTASSERLDAEMAAGPQSAGLPVRAAASGGAAAVGARALTRRRDGRVGAVGCAQPRPGRVPSGPPAVPMTSSSADEVVVLREPPPNALVRARAPARRRAGDASVRALTAVGCASPPGARAPPRCLRACTGARSSTGRSTCRSPRRWRTCSG